MTTPTLTEAALPEFDDARVQRVYEVLIDGGAPPDPAEHWEGFVARRIVAALAADEARPDPWREAVEEELVACGNMTASDDPRESVRRLIDWHCAVQIDPAVSSEAQALIERGRREAADEAREPVAPSTHSEEFIALRDGHRVASEDAYWAPRPIQDGAMQRRAYEDGFDRGFSSGWMVRDGYADRPPAPAAQDEQPASERQRAAEALLRSMHYDWDGEQWRLGRLPAERGEQPAQGLADEREFWLGVNESLDKARGLPAAPKDRWLIRHNDDGEFGQATGWLYRDGGHPCAVTGKPVYVWRKLADLLATTGHTIVRTDSAALASAPRVPLTDEQIDGLRGLDTATRVRFYEHDFYVLSNFSAFNLDWKGLTFPTSEHAYHWEKFGRDDDEVLPDEIGDVLHAIYSASSAHEAFKLAERNKAARRPDWDEVKVGVMREIIRAKAAQHEYVRRKLLATGDRELVEDSWRDDFWGWGPNRDGQNMLGKLWMQVRAEIRAAAPHPEGGA